MTSNKGFGLLHALIPMSLKRHLQDVYIYNRVIQEKAYNVRKVPMFESVFFEVRTRCNGNCSFCAASVQSETRADMSMEWVLYDKAIIELSDIVYAGRIAYHVNNDPLLFAGLSEFVKHARKYLPKAWIQILTNGSALTKLVADDLLESGINELDINLYRRSSTDSFPRRIKQVIEEVVTKHYKPHEIQAGFGPDPEGSPVFRLNLFPRSIFEVLETRAGSSPNKREKSSQPRGFCEYPFTQINISANGIVSKCCADFYFFDSMGNLRDETLLEIWNGRKFHKVRGELLEGLRCKNVTCSQCDFYGVFDHARRFSMPIEKLVYDLTI